MYSFVFCFTLFTRSGFLSPAPSLSDQIAIDNDVMQVQIRTRPRTSYSTITQVAVKIKSSPEQILHVKLAEG